jgi:putative DNA primase/helicase
MSPLTEKDKLEIAQALDRQSDVYHDDAPRTVETRIPPLDFSEPHSRRADAFGPGNGIAASADRVAARLTKAQLEKRQLTTQTGALRGCLANALDLLRFSPEWAGVLAFNQFTLRIVTKKATPWGKPAGETWTDRDDALCLDWLERKGVFLNSSKKSAEVVAVIAEENGFHPVKDYFRSLKWDGKPRLDSLFTKYAGAEDTPLNRAAGRIFLIGAIARIERPGCQHDTVPLLIGAQGVGKSSFCREACPQAEYFTDHVSELGSKDSRIELAGKMIVEFAELDRIKGRELGRVKAFLTARVDAFRPPYGRSVIDVPRSCVFVGTSNDEVALADETGNRRFLPVRVEKIRIEALAKDKGQLWAEAFSRYSKGARWYLDTQALTDAAKEEQDRCYAPGQWDEALEAFLENPQPRTVSDRPFHSTRGRILLEEALIEGVGKSKEHWTQADYNSAARCLIHNGYKRKQFRLGERRLWFYILEDEK